MILADLHTHTNFSDGELSPSEILNEALVKKIKYLSITDHDTYSAYSKEVLKAAKEANPEYWETGLASFESLATNIDSEV